MVNRPTGLLDPIRPQKRQLEGIIAFILISWGSGSPLLNTDPDTILFIPLRGDRCNPDFEWAAAGKEQIPRRCPKCLCDSITGHGWRSKQAHDETHDWIEVRRGICRPCHLTLTFLPVFSPPYTHYSLVARSQALRRYFLEHRSFESAAPPLKDPDRVPDPRSQLAPQSSSTLPTPPRAQSCS
jgi:Domain of unknown function (DUF6431)